MTTKTQGSKVPIVRALTLSKSVYGDEQAAIKHLTGKGWDTASFELTDEDDVWMAKSTDEYAKDEISQPRWTMTRDAGVRAAISEVLKVAILPADPVEAPVAAAAAGAPVQVDPADMADDDEDGAAEDLARNPTAGVQRTFRGIKLAKVKRVIVIPPEPVANVIQASAGTSEAATSILKFRGELATKYDWFAAYMSDDTTLFGVMKDGMSYDDLPPGIETVLDAVMCTASNILGDSTVVDKGAAIGQLGTDFAQITLGLYELFAKANATLNDDAAQKFANTFKASLQTAAKKSIVFADVVAASTDSVVEAAPVAKAVEVPDVAAMIAKAVQDGLAPMVAKVEETARTVEAMGNRTPSRKSMSDVWEDVQPAPAVKTESDEHRSAMFRSLMGGRPQPQPRNEKH